jgi:hypothetical protein
MNTNLKETTLSILRELDKVIMVEQSKLLPIKERSLELKRLEELSHLINRVGYLLQDDLIKL